METVSRETEESKDKKSETGKEKETGTKRRIEDWGEHTKRLKTRAEARAGESKNPGKGMDIGELGWHCGRLERYT